VEIEAVRVFTTDFADLDEAAREHLAEHLRGLAEVATQSFVAACARDASCAKAGRHSARVRVSPYVVEVLEHDAAAVPGWTGAVRSALAQAAAQAPPPALLQRPASWGGAGELELVVSATPPSRERDSPGRH
jgi:hypothetical protein